MFGTLSINASAVLVCAADGCQNKCLQHQNLDRTATSLTNLQLYTSKCGNFVARCRLRRDVGSQLQPGDEDGINGIPEFHIASKEVFKAIVSAGKVMVTVSWHIHGIIHVDFTPRGAMVTTFTYQATIQHLQEEIGRRKPHLLTTIILGRILPSGHLSLRMCLLLTLQHRLDPVGLYVFLQTENKKK